MKKNNKAFTLIELLAIIVILAIIAVITVPIILDIIENSRRGAATDSAYGYKDSVNKYYVSKLSETGNDNLKLEGTYTITDGVLNGTGINQKIPVSGTEPTSGALTYENGVFKNGCLTIGEYAVTFNEDGTTDTDKGKCPKVSTSSKMTLYYTSDSTAEAGPNGFTTEKKPEINPSWTFYIKETTQTGVIAYTMEGIEEGQKWQDGNFETLSICNDALNSIYQPEEKITFNIRCVETNTKITNETCGLVNGTPFCLKPNDYENSVKTLNIMFPGCNAVASSDVVSCSSSGLEGYANSYGGAHIGSCGFGLYLENDGNVYCNRN